MKLRKMCTVDVQAEVNHRFSTLAVNRKHLGIFKQIQVSMTHTCPFKSEALGGGAWTLTFKTEVKVDEAGSQLVRRSLGMDLVNARDRCKYWCSRYLSFMKFYEMIAGIMLIIGSFSQNIPCTI